MKTRRGEEEQRLIIFQVTHIRMVDFKDTFICSSVCKPGSVYENVIQQGCSRGNIIVWLHSDNGAYSIIIYKYRNVMYDEKRLRF